VVLGPIADQVAGEIRATLRAPPPSIAAPPPSMAAPPPSIAAPAIDAPGLLAALGGRGNVVDFGTFANRLLIRSARPDRIDDAALGKLGFRGIARSAADSIQLLVAGAAEKWDEPLRRLL
jgi:N-acetylglucosamine PTS system EIICBA or EIICB component